MTNELIEALRIAATVALFGLFTFLAVLGGLVIIGVAFRLWARLQTWLYWRELKQRKVEKGKSETKNLQS